jgi:hypothetical protein
MPDVLAFKALGYALIGLLAFTILILSIVSLRSEIIFGTPPNGFSPVIIIITALCVVIALVTAYVQLQRPVSTGGLKCF